MPELRRFNPLADFTGGQQAKQRNILGDLQLEQAKQQQATTQRQSGISQEQRRLQFMNLSAKALLSINEAQWPQAVQRLTPLAQQIGIDVSQFDVNTFTRENLQSVVASTDEFIANPQALTAAIQEFEHLAKAGNMNPQQRQDFALTEAGLKGKATGAAPQIVDVGGVPHMFDKQKKTLVPIEIEGQKVTTTTVAGSEAEIAGEVVSAKETRKGEAQLAVGGPIQIQKANLKRISELNQGTKGRTSSVKKARQFMRALKSGSAHSGAGRSALAFVPGVYTSQGQFDELFNAFAEVAARQKLKDSGEIRPTDADVKGMKLAMFGVGRDEKVNIQLLSEFISDTLDADDELDDLLAARKAGGLASFVRDSIDTSQQSGDLDAQALEWAQQNPNDPRAQQIMQALGQ